MNNKMIAHSDIMDNIISIDMSGRNHTGELIFDVLTRDGYIYSDISEASIRDLRPELIY